ncbi:hypothetical protein [Asticcacaulis endophyticus]|uniref:Uncharacterized protein n=1 Tax=Asticcacaulis endophyticus TaxID=1395890 RepID=A0A918PSY2_9CAUL|nr:hypothetical protein [Asticcacaulis endophyticus]GGZ21834.1 hypothetical protein GCM10011273_03270 [Asticcacaulis endophyticus]
MTHYAEQREAEADDGLYTEKLRYIAGRIRARQQIGGIGDDLKSFVWANRAKSELFADARLIIDTFPGQFPLSAEKAAD